MRPNDSLCLNAYKGNSSPELLVFVTEPKFMWFLSQFYMYFRFCYQTGKVYVQSGERFCKFSHGHTLKSKTIYTYLHILFFIHISSFFSFFVVFLLKNKLNEQIIILCSFPYAFLYILIERLFSLNILKVISIRSCLSPVCILIQS